MNNKEYLGKILNIEIDREFGSKHPKHGFIYPVNYGFIPNTISGDGEELDCYLLGVFEPVKTYKGKCIAIVHRTNDDDDKLIIVPENKEYSDDYYNVSLVVKDIHDGVNHMIALGRGELAERMIYECWRLFDGSITESEAEAIADGVTGINVRTYVYDYPSAEDMDVLKESAIEKFNDNADTVSFDISNVNDADIGDFISIRERIIGLSMIKKVKSRLYKGYLDNIKVSNNIGD